MAGILEFTVPLTIRVASASPISVVPTRGLLRVKVLPFIIKLPLVRANIPLISRFAFIVMSQPAPSKVRLLSVVILEGKL